METRGVPGGAGDAAVKPIKNTRAKSVGMSGAAVKYNTTSTLEESKTQVEGKANGNKNVKAGKKPTKRGNLTKINRIKESVVTPVVLEAEKQKPVIGPQPNVTERDVNHESADSPSDSNGGKAVVSFSFSKSQKAKLVSLSPFQKDVDGANVETTEDDSVPVKATVEGPGKDSIVEEDKTETVKQNVNLTAFLKVKSKDETKELNWPIEMIQYTKIEPPISFCCNPLYFNFSSLLKGKSKLSVEDDSKSKLTPPQNDLAIVDTKSVTSQPDKTTPSSPSKPSQSDKTTPSSPSKPSQSDKTTPSSPSKPENVSIISKTDVDKTQDDKENSENAAANDSNLLNVEQTTDTTTTHKHLKQKKKHRSKKKKKKRKTVKPEGEKELGTEGEVKLVKKKSRKKRHKHRENPTELDAEGKPVEKGHKRKRKKKNKEKTEGVINGEDGMDITVQDKEHKSKSKHKKSKKSSKKKDDNENEDKEDVLQNKTDAVTGPGEPEQEAKHKSKHRSKRRKSKKVKRSHKISEINAKKEGTEEVEGSVPSDLIKKEEEIEKTLSNNKISHFKTEKTSTDTHVKEKPLSESSDRKRKSSMSEDVKNTEPCSQPKMKKGKSPKLEKVVPVKVKATVPFSDTTDKGSNHSVQNDKQISVNKHTDKDEKTPGSVKSQKDNTKPIVNDNADSSWNAMEVMYEEKEGTVASKPSWDTSDSELENSVDLKTSALKVNSKKSSGLDLKQKNSDNLKIKKSEKSRGRRSYSSSSRSYSRYSSDSYDSRSYSRSSSRSYSRSRSYSGTRRKHRSYSRSSSYSTSRSRTRSRGRSGRKRSYSRTRSQSYSSSGYSRSYSRSRSSSWSRSRSYSSRRGRSRSSSYSSSSRSRSRYRRTKKRYSKKKPSDRNRSLSSSDEEKPSSKVNAGETVSSDLVDIPLPSVLVKDEVTPQTQRLLDKIKEKKKMLNDPETAKLVTQGAAESVVDKIAASKHKNDQDQKDNADEKTLIDIPLPDKTGNDKELCQESNPCDTTQAITESNLASGGQSGQMPLLAPPPPPPMGLHRNPGPYPRLPFPQSHRGPYPGGDRMPFGDRPPFPMMDRPRFMGDRPRFMGDRPPFPRPEMRPYMGNERHPFPGNERHPFPGNERHPFPGNERHPFPGNERHPFPGNERHTFPGNERPRFPGNDRPRFPGNDRPPFYGNERPPFRGDRMPYRGEHPPFPRNERPQFPGRPPFPGGDRPPFAGRFPPPRGDYRPDMCRMPPPGFNQRGPPPRMPPPGFGQHGPGMMGPDMRGPRPWFDPGDPNMNPEEGNRDGPPPLPPPRSPSPQPPPPPKKEEVKVEPAPLPPPIIIPPEQEEQYRQLQAQAQKHAKKQQRRQLQELSGQPIESSDSEDSEAQAMEMEEAVELEQEQEMEAQSLGLVQPTLIALPGSENPALQTHPTLIMAQSPTNPGQLIPQMLTSQPQIFVSGGSGLYSQAGGLYSQAGIPLQTGAPMMALPGHAGGHMVQLAGHLPTRIAYQSALSANAAAAAAAGLHIPGLTSGALQMSAAGLPISALSSAANPYLAGLTGHAIPGHALAGMAGHSLAGMAGHPLAGHSLAGHSLAGHSLAGHLPAQFLAGAGAHPAFAHPGLQYASPLGHPMLPQGHPQPIMIGNQLLIPRIIRPAL